MSGMLYALAHTPTAEQRNLWGAECWPGRSMHRMQTTYPPAPCQWVQPARKCQWVSCLPIHVGITPLGWIPVLSLVDWWWCAISAISSIHILITFMSVSPPRVLFAMVPWLKPLDRFCPLRPQEHLLDLWWKKKPIQTNFNTDLIKILCYSVDA